MRRAARLLRNARFSAVYTSPLRRARDGARIIAAPHRITARTDPRFSEIDFGSLEGLTFQEAAERFPEIYNAWMETPEEVEFPGGESLRRMRGRVLAAWHEVRRRHAGKTVAIVSHGGVGRLILGDALGLDIDRLFRMEQTYGAVSVVDYYGDTPLIRLLNAVPSPDLGLRC